MIDFLEEQAKNRLGGGHRDGPCDLRFDPVHTLTIFSFA